MNFVSHSFSPIGFIEFPQQPSARHGTPTIKYSRDARGKVGEYKFREVVELVGELAPRS